MHDCQESPAKTQFLFMLLYFHCSERVATRMVSIGRSLRTSGDGVGPARGASTAAGPDARSRRYVAWGREVATFSAHILKHREPAPWRVSAVTVSMSPCLRVSSCAGGGLVTRWELVGVHHCPRRNRVRSVRFAPGPVVGDRACDRQGGKVT